MNNFELDQAARDLAAGKTEYQLARELLLEREKNKVRHESKDMNEHMAVNNIHIIKIEVSGPVSSGKSSVLASIRDILEGDDYCVCIPDRAERHNPSLPISKAKSHEKPKIDKCVFILSEVTRP